MPYTIQSEFLMDSRRLNSELLRTFLAIAEEGSVTAGAGRIGRSQSAASLQIKQLEEVVGQSVFLRRARGIELTETGKRLLPVARQTTHHLDRTLDELRGEGLRGKIRLGLPDDHGRAHLADIVADFAERHPDVELESHCSLGLGFADALGRGLLDLAIYAVPAPPEARDVLGRDRMIWARSRRRELGSDGVLPVALYDRNCWWRDVALASLAAQGRRFRVVFTSESATGVHAAVRAGIAVALLRESEVHGALAPLAGVAAEVPSYLILRRAPAASGPALDAMEDAIRFAFHAKAA